ncbi:MAG: hypothetical protein HY082_00060 [Gammaproteobacteria bacterium]|nr:hypothetical protein [Gammaproteobacteria bacterium]
MQHRQPGIRQPRRLLGGMFLALLLTACGSGGGGGGGGSSSSGSNTLSYTGITSQAAVTASNADDLSAGAVLDAGTGASVSLAGVVGNETSPPAKVRSVTVSTALKRALGRLDHTASSGTVAGAMVTVTDTLPGTCAVNPGTASFNMTADDVTGDFSGTISFNGYCDDGDTLTGEASFSGRIDPVIDEFTALNLSTSSLTVVSGADNFTIAGSLAFTAMTSVSENLSMTLDIRDGTGKMYRIENFLCALAYNSPSSGTDSVRVVSGRFYHPDHGYVDVASTSDFLFTGASDYPYAGVLVVTGRGGSKAILTAHSDAQTFEVKADTDGNGAYETGPTVYRWDSL